MLLNEDMNTNSVYELCIVIKTKIRESKTQKEPIFLVKASILKSFLRTYGVGLSIVPSVFR